LRDSSKTRDDTSQGMERSLYREYCHPESSRNLFALAYFHIKKKLQIEPL
jgi:hypothetical protein